MSTSPNDPHASAPNPQAAPHDTPLTTGWSISGSPQQPRPEQPTGTPPNFAPSHSQHGGPYNLYPPYGGAQTLPPSARLAPWAPRFGAKVLDLLMLVPFLLAAVIILAATSTSATYDPNTNTYSPGGQSVVGVAIALLLYAGVIAFSLYQLYRQGTTGQTIGKKVVGIRVIRETDGRPTGFGMAFVRNLAHNIDSISLYIGWLWPLWDAKKQTFADKMCGTLVILA